MHRTSAAVALFLVGGALGALLLPVRLSFSARTGTHGLLQGVHAARDGKAFAAGESVGVHLPTPDPDSGTVVLWVRLRRATNPVRLQIDRDGLAAVVIDLPRTPARVEASVEPLTRRLTLTARSAKPTLAATYLIERIELRRRATARRITLLLLPAAVGALVTWRWPRSTAAAVLYGLHAALAAAAGLVWAFDPAARLQFAPATWAHGAQLYGISLAALVLVPRLRQRDETSAHATLHPRHVVAAALLAASFLWTAAAALLSTNPTLAWLFGRDALRDAALLLRAREAAGALCWTAAGVAYAGVLAGTIRRLDRLGEKSQGIVVFTVLSVALIGSLESLLAPHYRPTYWPEAANARARADHALYLADPYLGHVLNPQARGAYTINSAGLRGSEFPSVKPPGEWRILALGDSIPFGIFLGEDAPFPAQLGTLLAARSRPGRSYRVLNAGVPGYDSLQARRVLERSAGGLAPDIIVVTVGWNDLSWSLASNWRPGQSIAFGWNPPRFRPAVFRFAEQLGAVRSVRRSQPDPRAVQAFHANLDAMVTAANGRTARILFTNLPTVLSAAGNTDEERRIAAGKLRLSWSCEHVRLFDEQIRSICQSHSEARCIDDLFSLTQTGKGPFFRDHCHPNAAGHARMAAQVLQALETFGWL